MKKFSFKGDVFIHVGLWVNTTEYVLAANLLKVGNSDSIDFVSSDIWKGTYSFCQKFKDSNVNHM
jgi:hypothetical protein